MFGYLHDLKNIIKDKRTKSKKKPEMVARFGIFRTIKFVKWFWIAFWAFLARQLFSATVTPFTNAAFVRTNAAATMLAMRLGIPQA